MAAITKPFIPCTDECMFAKGDDCECFCHGENHQVGTNGKLPADYAAYRTQAGRRINPAFKDAKEREAAEYMLHLHYEEGMTKRDIAKHCGVSGSTVRRYITRLLLAEDIQAEAEEAASEAA